MAAIVYKSNTGHTQRYAQMLGDMTGMSVYSLDEAKHQLNSDAEVVYLGWLCANEVKGFKTADKRFDVKAVVGCGMGATGTQVQEVRDRNHVTSPVPVFTVQGGLETEKLTGIYKLMMSAAKKGLEDELAKKETLSAKDLETQDLFASGGKVSMANLRSVLAWCAEEGLCRL